MKKKPPTPARKPANPVIRTGKQLQSQTKLSPPAAALTIRRLQAELAEAHARIAELRASAETDFLLDILNRRGFARELTRAVAYIARYRATGALIMLDVDRLKPINDNFGHAAGDVVLKAVVGVLRDHVRASDSIARLGGDEFVLLLWNLSEADACAKALQLEAAIDALRFSFGESQVSAGASAGVSVLIPEMPGAVALELADRAMYARKKERRETLATTDRT
ncbi:MAG: diguanylate cyclase [Tardiphaga sp.]|jgi:diguanylate cyclase (GGDEF)-like protein|nr:diguanylate cyclase [Tardiphaga sp.]